MRQLFSLYFLLFCVSFFSQVRLSDAAFEFKKSSEYHQLITKVNLETNEVFSFATDKEKLFGVKFNNALFFSDSLTIDKPEAFRYLMGCGFTDENNPIAYWATADLEKFIGIEFDFKTRTTKTIQYNLNLKNQTVFADFSAKRIHYFLTEKKETKSLLITSFESHKITTKELDFSKFKFENQNQKGTNVLDLLHEYGISKINTNEFNSYVEGTNPIKYYLRDNEIVITLDNTTRKTQLFEIDLNTFEIKETIISKESSQDLKRTNSLLFENYLVLLGLNKETFEIQILDYSNKNLIQKYQITENQPNPFNTTFVSQTANNSPNTLKNSKKLIKKLLSCNLGASFYRLGDDTVITTFGGTKEIRRNSDIALGIGLGLSSIMTGTALDYGDIIGDNYVYQNVFFDVQFDANFKTKENINIPLYIDKIAQFTSENRTVKYEYCFPYKDYYILSYYDKNENKIVLSKFTDGFDY